MNLLSLSRLLQLSSPSLPIGGFTYSQGLEWATEAGWITTPDAFKKWQLRQLKYSLVKVDLPVLKRLHSAYEREHLEEANYWGRWMLASRETAELRMEERQRSAALVRVLEGLEIAPLKTEWLETLRLSQTSGFAWAGWKWQIPLRELLLAYGYTWLENSVMAGLKLVPFGQQAAQSLLAELSESLVEYLPEAMALEDEKMGGSVPLVTISSALHETQHTRLFRS